MSDIEERLRDAYLTATDTVSAGSIRQLDEPSVVITWPAAKPVRSGRRWTVPLTTAAVLTVIAATTLTAFLTRGDGTASSPPGEHFVSVLTANSRKLIILNIATGARTASVTPPGKQETFRTAATGDGVTYVAAVTRPGGCGTRLYKFRLSAAGIPSRLTRFDGGYHYENVYQMALSADGRIFSYLVHSCSSSTRKLVASLDVLNAKTGQRTRWTLPGRSKISGLSLTSDGGVLALAGGPIDGVRSGIVLVNTSGASGSVRAHSRLLVRADIFGHGYTTSWPAITPDGRTVYFVSTGAGPFLPRAEQIRSAEVSTGHTRMITDEVTGMYSFAPDPAARRAAGILQGNLAFPEAILINLRTGNYGSLKSSFSVPDVGRYIW
jgi:hypothetical protein